MKALFGFLILILFVSSCGEKSPFKDVNDLDKIARQYVRLVLVTGKYDSDYVDAYFGPADLKKLADSDKMTVQQIKSATNDLLLSIVNLTPKDNDPLSLKRKMYLTRLLRALKTKLEMLEGKKFSFDMESKALYDAVSPIYNIKIYDDILNQLDAMIPGRGNLTKRFEEYRKRFIISPKKLDTVFKAAIAECRKRTKKFIELPPDERFDLEFVKSKPWGAYNWFKGNSRSLIQVNSEKPISIDRIIGLAAHEGYPGHHVFHSLFEKELYKKRNWVEFSIYPLFSPVSMISEGMANFGITLVFPQNEKLAFEKQVLYPLAGINSSEAENYTKILNLIQKLTYSGNEAGRRFLDGNMSEEHTIDWLMTYQLQTEDRAMRYVSFIKKYRSYIITYNVGEDLIKSYFSKQLKNGGTSADRWNLFRKIITGLTLPQNLIIDK